MPVETDADRAAFVDQDDFGVAAVYAPAEGGTASFNVISFRPPIEIGIEDVPAIDVSPYVIARSSDIPSNAASGDAGDLMTVDGEQFRVVALKPDGSGMTRIDLRK